MPDDCEADEADKGGRCGGRRRRGNQDISLPMRTWKRRQAEEDERDGPDEDDEADEENETDDGDGNFESEYEGER